MPARRHAAGSTPDKGFPRPAPVGQDTTADQLIGLVARGDERAFEQLYDRFSPAVYGLARSVVRDPHQAEEVTQEVLLQVWSTAARFDPEKGTARAWIATLAHRRAVDRVRSSQAARSRDEAAVAAGTERPYDEVSERVETRLEAERVRHCLDGLTPRQKDAVTLAYYQGNTYAQVASLLKLPLGTVKTRMRDGLIRLRDCLGVGHDGSDD